MNEAQATIYEGHGTLLQAALDDPGHSEYWLERRDPSGEVYYELQRTDVDVEDSTDADDEGEMIAEEVGSWVDVEELRGLEGNVNVRLNNGRTVTMGQGELTELVKLAGLQPHRRRGDEVFVPASWIVGERVGY